MPLLFRPHPSNKGEFIVDGVAGCCPDGRARHFADVARIRQAGTTNPLIETRKGAIGAEAFREMLDWLETNREAIAAGRLDALQCVTPGNAPPEAAASAGVQETNRLIAVLVARLGGRVVITDEEWRKAENACDLNWVLHQMPIGVRMILTSSPEAAADVPGQLQPGDLRTARLAGEMAQLLRDEGIEIDWHGVIAWAKHMAVHLDCSHTPLSVIDYALSDSECWDAAKREIKRLRQAWTLECDDDAAAVAGFVEHVLCR